MWMDHKTKQLPLGTKEGHSLRNLHSLTALPLGPSPHLIVSLSKGLTGVSRGAMKKETDSSYAHVSPSTQPHHSLWLPYIQPDLHLQENLYKGIEKWLSSKS